jgi:hypothetical protein
MSDGENGSTKILEVRLRLGADFGAQDRGHVRPRRELHKIRR